MGGVDVFNQRLISDFAADYLEALAQNDQAKYSATQLGSAAAWQVSKE